MLSSQHIKWAFNLPHRPHHGGVFEVVIKSAKRATGAVLHDASCTDEELKTAIVKAEGLLNSRPLTTTTSKAGDLKALTPSHFLIGAILSQQHSIMKQMRLLEYTRRSDGE